MEQQHQLCPLKLSARRGALSNQPPTTLDEIGGKPGLGERRRTGHRATPFAGNALLSMPNAEIVTQDARKLQPYSYL